MTNSLGQLWKMRGTTLVNRAKIWKSNDEWKLTTVKKSSFVYIANVSEKKFLGIVDDSVMLVGNCESHMWLVGEPNREGFFTITSAYSEKALSAFSMDLTIGGKHVSSNLLSLYPNSDYVFFLHQIEIHLVYGDCLNQ